jgi:hypothetical protein
MKRFVLPSALLAFMLMLSAIFFSAKSTAATTHYVASNGSDSNAGTTETAPWAHLPGMRTASGTAGSYTPVAGDTFILRGCDSWPNASFDIQWNWSGTSSSPITIDRDTTWYNTATCPAGWNRPVFDAGSAIIRPPECTNNNAFWTFGTVNWVNVNWIELVNYRWTSPQANGSCFSNEYMVYAPEASTHIHLSNWYVHKWTIPSTADDIDHAFMEGCETCSVDYMVANNVDGTQYTGLGMQWPTQHSVLAYVANALKPNMSGEFSYNDISHVDNYIANVHSNCIESIPPIRGSGHLYIHDNRVHDNGSCEGLQVGNPGESDYVWNNIWYNNTSVGANGPQIPQNDNNAVAFYYFNNTNADSDTVCVRTDSPGKFWSSAFVMVNNHCITNGSPTGTSQSQGMLNQTISGSSTILFGNNVVESATTASGQGYTNSQTFVYSPTSATAPTVGTGQNLTSSYWPAGYAANDTTYACSQQTVSGVVQSVCPAHAPNARPTSGAWNVGAYQFGTSSSSTTPAPPTGINAVAR